MIGTKLQVLIFLGACLCLEAVVIPPRWPPAYRYRANLHVPSVEIIEPIEVWCNKGRLANVARIDSYDGIDKVFVYGLSRAKKTFYHIHPTIVGDNVTTVCELTHSVYSWNDLLPILTNFWLDKTATMNNKTVELWKYTDEYTTQTMFLYYQGSDNSTIRKIPVPLKYSVRSISGDYYMIFEDFSTDVPSSVFSPPEELHCPRAETSHDFLYDFFPLGEYIHGAHDHVDKTWEHHKNKFGKIYEADEDRRRKDIFRQNMRLITSTNRANKGYTLGVNFFVDQTPDEMKSYQGLNLPPSGTIISGVEPYVPQSNDTLPDWLDWRYMGAVTTVKDQFKCGSCWTFSTVGVLEAAYFQKTGHLIDLSEQALIDCAWGECTKQNRCLRGCNSGNQFLAFKWVQRHGGIPTDDSYGGYLAKDNICHYKNSTLVAPVQTIVQVQKGNDTLLKRALYENGPIAVGINIPPDFAHYRRGVYINPNCDPDDLTHAVLLVGYGTYDKRNYWLIKNSYSNKWGLDGYMMMDMEDNNCGVTEYAFFVTL